MRGALIAAAGAALLLSACSESRIVSPAAVKAAADGTPLTSASMPYVGFSVFKNDQPACQGMDAANLVGKAHGDYYIRFSADYLPPDSTEVVATAEGQAANGTDGGPRKFLADRLSYDKARRNLLERLLLSENRTFTLSGQLDIAGHQIAAPLYAASHGSGSDGEAFSHDLNLMWQNLYIKVSGHTNIGVTFEGKFSNDVTTGALGAGLRVAKVAIGALNPAAQMLTTLNQDRVQKEAQIWDAALGKAMSSTADEKIQLTKAPEQIGSNFCGMLTLAVPGPSYSVVSMNMDPTVLVGRWRVGVNEARRSLFSDDTCLNNDDWETCSGAPPSASSVLQQQMGDNKTVSDFIKSDKSYDDLAAIGAADSDAQSAYLADSFCRGAVSALEGAGLTTVDARLGLWAVISGMRLPGNGEVKDQLVKTCRGYTKPFTPQ